ncbi:MAG: hypothetical protein H0V64_03570 [Geodermatophilaceae bacterium]|nr:hypothetical protein [Geodermatophilaceae bacterium]MDQ3464689.1 hypothetical protein [Actinomycetota bacterium]
MSDERRRRRVRDVAATQADEAATTARGSGRVARPRTEGTDAERGLRGLVGAGPTQVDIRAAMRARDASRPRPADLAAAETDLVIIRRHWQPPD